MVHKLKVNGGMGLIPEESDVCYLDSYAVVYDKLEYNSLERGFFKAWEANGYRVIKCILEYAVEIWDLFLRDCS